MNRLIRTAIAGAAIAAAVLFVRQMAYPIAVVGPSSAPPSSAQSPSTERPSTPAPSRTLAGANARPWPNPASNRGGEYPPGLYVWDGPFGWMHNGYQDVGEGEGVSLMFSITGNRYARGPTAVTIGGYPGTYVEYDGDLGVRVLVWVVEFESRNVKIELETQPNATTDEVAEARAIVESITYEESATGFRLFFTLPGGWDSG